MKSLGVRKMYSFLITCDLILYRNPMKKYILICILTFSNLSCSEKNHQKENASSLAAKNAPKAVIAYDSLLAEKAGADDYGMRQ